MIKNNETTAIPEEKKTPCELKNTKGMAVGRTISKDFRPHFEEM
jgi:hypothetical protein